MHPSPRVLLSIDYEPWFALTRRYDRLTGSTERRDLDGGFTLSALDAVLDKLGTSQASFYLVGEIADWYPEVPAKIAGAGHELGLHCHMHRPLVNLEELAADIRAAASWTNEYGVRGYRAPMVGIQEAAYAVLEEAGFEYSSSIYAPTGTMMQKGNLWEVPVSTYNLFHTRRSALAPRNFSLGLLASGEFPYGSSFSIAMLGGLVLRILERELKAGRSPVIILHPYELVTPSVWPSRIFPDIVRNPLLWPFTWNKSRFLAEVLRSFPTSSLAAYLDEVLATSAKPAAQTV
jgi:polysaccharide deacetylase